MSDLNQVGEPQQIAVDIAASETGRPPRLYKGVIFDMDGLLIDSERVYRRGWEEGLAQCLSLPDRHSEVDSDGETEWITDELYRDMLGISSDEVCKLFIDRWDGIAEKFDTIKSRRDEYLEVSLPIRAMDGAAELVAELHRRGIPTAVASSTKRSDIFRLLRGALIDVDKIDVIVGGDEVSKGKPDPEIFRKAAERMAIELEDCLVLEDGRNGVLAAKSGNADCVYIPTIRGDQHPAAAYTFGSLLAFVAASTYYTTTNREVRRVL